MPGSKSAASHGNNTMRHRLAGKQLGRTLNQRKALFNGQIKQMLEHGAIETTDAKAKALIPSLEKLGHRILKTSEIVAQRELQKLYNDRKTVSAVYKQFMATFQGVTTNLTKVQKVKFRQGDNALVVKISFVKPYSLKKVEEKAPDQKAEKPVEAPKKAVKKVAKK